ncbi:unnamed protein product [Strongylus vulgaris]|uniref:Uncharacterized protein n=1 Tax=Strongylus vulgaris TaxID=40348 RepID=A0A3P7L4P5_STRVU|nr:unnamed protein product [Strongylus vulgaris]
MRAIGEIRVDKVSHGLTHLLFDVLFFLGLSRSIRYDVFLGIDPWSFGRVHYCVVVDLAETVTIRFVSMSQDLTAF